MGWYYMATIETYSKPPVEPVPDMISHVSKADMSNTVYFDEKDEIIYFSGRKKPIQKTPSNRGSTCLGAWSLSWQAAR